MTEILDTVSSASFAEAIDARLARVRAEDVVGRIWAGDHTVWSPEPAECADRLGWLRAPESMLQQVEALETFAHDTWGAGFTTVVLLGMGGSSLAPEVMQQVLGSAPGALEIIVLDTTHPDELLRIVRDVDEERTLFIASSKSGSTVETRSQLEYFWDRVPHGRQYVAITDAGSSLERIATDRGFRKVFLNDPEVGGRYSALTYFGLVPAALMGCDIRAMLNAAKDAARDTRRDDPGHNVAVRCGVGMGLAAAGGRDKLTILSPSHLRPFGAWLEQLLSESTGKQGKGILPIEGETGPAQGNDRLFVDFGPGSPRNPAVDHPAALDWWNWEFATAIAGHILELNPFDQPAVQSAKDATAAILGGANVDSTTPGIDDVLVDVSAGDYIGILAYLPRNHANDARLARVRARLSAHYDVATTSGFGPRYLHSTGQYHKGGPNTGIFLQLTDVPAEDVPIPGAGYTFGELHAAQALGDLDSLRSLGRRINRTTLAELEQYAAKL